MRTEPWLSLLSPRCLEWRPPHCWAFIVMWMNKLQSHSSLETALSALTLLTLLFFVLSSRSLSQEEDCPPSAPWQISTASPTTIPSNLRTSSWPPCLESWPLHRVSSTLGQKTWGQGEKWKANQRDRNRHKMPHVRHTLLPLEVFQGRVAETGHHYQAGLELAAIFLPMPHGWAHRYVRLFSIHFWFDFSSLAFSLSSTMSIIHVSYKRSFLMALNPGHNLLMHNLVMQPVQVAKPFWGWISLSIKWVGNVIRW